MIENLNIEEELKTKLILDHDKRMKNSLKRGIKDLVRKKKETLFTKRKTQSKPKDASSVANHSEISLTSK